MKKTLFAAALAAAVCVGLLPGQPPAGAFKGKAKAKAEPEVCDRTCLEGFVTQYLDALVAHNPFGGLPLAARVKFTENDQVLDLGDGLWNVTTGVGKYKLIVADPESQQVGFLGTVFANERPTTLALRLKLENRKITEIETLVTVSNPPLAGKGEPPTPTGAAALDLLVAPDAAMLRAETERRTRDQLVAAANGYFEAIERSDASAVPFSAQCNRLENGVQMTNSKTLNAAAIDPRALSCADQIRARVLSNYQVIYPRRAAVVDEERQMVFGFFMYQQPGDLLQVESPGRGAFKFSEAASQPGFVETAQALKFVGGNLLRIESLTMAVPYGTPNPFFNDDWRRSK
jgi:hypothetical protein